MTSCTTDVLQEKGIIDILIVANSWGWPIELKDIHRLVSKSSGVSRKLELMEQVGLCHVVHPSVDRDRSVYHNSRSTYVQLTNKGKVVARHLDLIRIEDCDVPPSGGVY